MTRSRLLLTLIVTALAGCTPTYRTDRPGWTQAEGDRDAYECHYQSQSLARTPQSVAQGPGGAMVYSDPSFGWADLAVAGRMRDACMKARGYWRE